MTDIEVYEQNPHLIEEVSCPEFQKGWEPKEGELFAVKEHNGWELKAHKVFVIGDQVSGIKLNNAIKNGSYEPIFLPSLCQLMGMLRHPYAMYPANNWDGTNCCVDLLEKHYIAPTLHEALIRAIKEGK